ncbi:MAG: glycosyltransferase, partial [Fimbriiglobus sp.]
APLVEIPDRGPFDRSVVPALLDVLRRERVAVWHGHDYKTNALGLLLNRFHRMKLVTTVHGWVHHTARTPLYYAVDRLTLRHYDRVFCVSEDLVRECRRSGVPKSRCVLLENGIDTDEYVRRQTAEQAKKALGFDPARLLVGSVGRLAPEKDYGALVRAVRVLADRGRDVTLVIVGEGDERPALEALARELGVADRVTLPGWRADVRDHLEAMDVFALSSLREGLPNALLEAMALEVPAVATRVAGIPRLVRDGETGRLVDPGNAPALADAIGELLGNPEIRAGFAAAGRRRIADRYSFAARMRILADAYSDLLRGTAHDR